MGEDRLNGASVDMEVIFNKLTNIEENHTEVKNLFATFSQEVLNLQKSHEKTNSSHNQILRGIRKELYGMRKDNQRALMRKGVSEKLLITIVTIIALITGLILFHNSSNELHGKFGQAELDIKKPGS